MAAPYIRTLAAVGISAACPTSHLESPFNATVAVVFTGTATASVEYTLDDPAGASDTSGTGLTWFSHATLAAITANAVGNFAFPVRATRLNCTAWTSGTVTMTFLRAGAH